MRHALEPDHDLYANEAPADLVLGAPALVGIFFAIAVVCAVCFGFGYSAHSGVPRAAQTSASASATNHVPRPLGPSPSAARQDAATENEDLDTPGELSGLPPEPDRTGEIPATQAMPTQARPKPAPAVRFATPPGIALPSTSEEASTDPVPVPSIKPYPGVTMSPHIPLTMPSVANEPVPAESAPFEGLMVQIAAVSRAADAQTLAAALRHDGFAAIVRASDGDQFFHVQVGPFATREAAKAMRAKLSDNGYNAFVRR